MSTTFDNTVNSILKETYTVNVYQPADRIEDIAKFKDTLAHVGHEDSQDDDALNTTFQKYKGRTMAEVLKELMTKPVAGTTPTPGSTPKSPAQPKAAVTAQSQYSGEDPLRRQIKRQPQEGPQ